MKNINNLTMVRFLRFIRINKMFLIHYVTFCFSLIFGILTVVLDFSFANEEFSAVWNSFIKADYFQTFISYFLFCLLVSLLFLLNAFFAFGTPLSFVLFSVLGFGSGCLLSAVYREFGLIGFLINAVLFILPTLVIFFIYTLLSGASITVSNGLIVSVFTGHLPNNFNRSIKDCVILFIISVFATAVISAVRALLVNVFLGVLYV